MTSSSTGPGAEADLDLVVARRTTEAVGVVGLELRRPDGADLPAWQPGAHIDLRLPLPGGDRVRQYSLCSDPGDRSAWRLAVLREANGRGGSRHIHDVLAEGDTVRTRGPRNHFPLRPAGSYLFVAGGIGITPVLPMLAEAERHGADWRLVYGGRTAASMAFAARLVDRYGPRVLLRPEESYGLLDLDGLLGTPRPDRLVYCCGPDPLMDAVRERCARRPQEALHTERFAPAPTGAPLLRGDFEVELARSGTTVMVAPDTSILRAVEEAGVQVLSSCREGTCGTCETAVLEGTVDHRDALLTPAERAAHDTMMICVSRAAGPRLVLDL